MTTTTDINSMVFHPPTRINDETNNSFVLNQSIDRMDIDDNTHALIGQVSTTINGHISPIHVMENGIKDNDKQDIFHQG